MDNFYIRESRIPFCRTHIINIDYIMRMSKIIPSSVSPSASRFILSLCII